MGANVSGEKLFVKPHFTCVRSSGEAIADLPELPANYVENTLQD
ncbi:DUF5951 family protein [Enterobacter kobei]